jgi:hypothetical protein
VRTFPNDALRVSQTGVRSAAVRESRCQPTNMPSIADRRRPDRRPQNDPRPDLLGSFDLPLIGQLLKPLDARTAVRARAVCRDWNAEAALELRGQDVDDMADHPDSRPYLVRLVGTLHRDDAKRLLLRACHKQWPEVARALARRRPPGEALAAALVAGEIDIVREVVQRCDVTTTEATIREWGPWTGCPGIEWLLGQPSLGETTLTDSLARACCCRRLDLAQSLVHRFGVPPDPSRSVLYVAFQTNLQTVQWAATTWDVAAPEVWEMFPDLVTLTDLETLRWAADHFALPADLAREALLWVATCGILDKAQWLVDRFDMNGTHQEEREAFSAACAHGHLELAIFLKDAQSPAADAGPDGPNDGPNDALPTSVCDPPTSACECWHCG